MDENRKLLDQELENVNGGTGTSSAGKTFLGAEDHNVMVGAEQKEFYVGINRPPEVDEQILK